MVLLPLNYLTNKWLTISERPVQEAAVPGHRPDVSNISHCHPVNGYKAPCQFGTNSTFEGNMQEYIWSVESQVHMKRACTAKLG